MYHAIEFCTSFTADLEVSPKQRLEQLRLHAGTKVHANLLPYVVETAQGPIEVADLRFEDGTVARRVRFDQFRFVE
jgi:hypothetical protein